LEKNIKLLGVLRVEKFGVVAFPTLVSPTRGLPMIFGGT